MCNAVQRLICGFLLLVSSLSSAFGKSYLVIRDDSSDDIGTRLEILDVFAEHGKSAITLEVRKVIDREWRRLLLLTWDDVKGHNDEVRRTLRYYLLRGIAEPKNKFTIVVEEGSPHDYRGDGIDEVYTLKELWYDGSELDEETTSFSKFVEDEYLVHLSPRSE